ncbi:MAG: ATP-binding protein [Thermoguttaceae bacterium]
MKRRRRAETLVRLQRDVALHLAAATDTVCGLARCVETLLEIPELDNAAVFLPNTDGSFALAAHAGLSDVFVERMRYVAPTSERVAYLKEGNPHYYSRTHPLSSREESEPLEAEGIRAVAAVPICHNKRVVGCLAAGSRAQDSLPPMVREFVEGVAGQIGAAIARLQAEELLHVKDQAIAASVNGVAISDTAGCLTYVNEAFVTMWGYDAADECLGRPVLEFWAEPAAAADAIRRVQASGSAVGEMQAVRRDGSHFDVEFVSVLVYDSEGRTVARMASFLDISARKQAEEAMEDAERLRAETERFLAAGRMAANVAHEINNPLAGITNCFRLVKQAIPPDHPHQKFAGLIEEELARIGRIVLQMHELSRPNQEPVESISVRRAADGVATMLAPMCRQHQVRIETEIEPDDLTLHLPRGLLSQVLYNLLVNAIEASPEQSIVRLSAGCRNGQTCIAVRDCGPGVPAHVGSELFEPFYTTKGGCKPGGLGLGLYLSKQLICSVGGELSLVPTAERGATFQILLPQPKW